MVVINFHQLETPLKTRYFQLPKIMVDNLCFPGREKRKTLRIRLYVLRKGMYLESYSGDGIGTLNPIYPILGMGLDS